MEILILAPFILLLTSICEMARLSLKLRKTNQDRKALFQNEQKAYLFSYVLVVVVWVYLLVTGKSIAYAILATFWTLGTHLGAFIWNEKGSSRNAD